MSDWVRWATPTPELSPGAWAFLRAELGAVQPRSRPPVDVDAIAIAPTALSTAAIARLGEAVGRTHVVTDERERLHHCGGQSYVDLIRRRTGAPAAAPDAVVRPGSAGEVSRVVQICAEERIAVVPFGGGTSVVGGVDPLAGPHAAVVALDLQRMRAIVAVDPVSQLVTVEPGVRALDLEAELSAAGLTLGHLPQSVERATVGGYVATRSAGQASTGYGRIDDLVVGVRLATPSGELVLRPVPGSAAGPDLRRLVLGSEGVFGVVTEVTLRVRAAPAVRRYEAWGVPSFTVGLAAVRTLAQDGPPPDIVRLSDLSETRAGLQLSAAPAAARRALSAYLRVRAGRDACLLVFGFEGSASDTGYRRWVARRILHRHGAIALGQGAGRGWERGRYGGPRVRDALLDAGVLAETLETAGTWTALPELYEAVTTALRDSIGPRVLVGCHVSHVYPVGASLYFTVLAPVEAGAEIPVWERAKRAAGDAIVASEGTITHHHAVGTAHRPWLAAEDGELGVAMLRAVKERVDPHGVMNPGKLLPDATA